MSNQYIIAYFGDGTLVVDAVGPFRSIEKAERVLERLTRADDKRSESFDVAAAIPQVVTLKSLPEALDQLEGDIW